MPKLNVPATRSVLLTLRRQLTFAEEGFDLLDQKRQILVSELLSRLRRAAETERQVREALQHAHSALRNALLDIGSEMLDNAALGVRANHQATITTQSIMGLRLPRVGSHIQPPAPHFSLYSTSANVDIAMQRFTQILPLIAELAELQNAFVRLARELRKTQRRCNALSKILIPAHRETIASIGASLEERDRESFTILKMIRDRYRTVG